MASATAAAGQLRIPLQITINLQPPAIVCTAVTNASSIPSINCVGGALVSPQESKAATSDYGEFSSRVIATKELEYIETTVSW